MMEHFATSPFGGARMRLSEIQDRNQISKQRKATIVEDGDASPSKIDKWRLTRALVEARHQFGLSDRAITVLEGLMSFHPDRELEGRRPVVVFPSNAELSLRCRGMAPATLRRHLASLCSVGLIFRRDSPNGKRYCRRGSDGTVEEAFGFDLSPVVIKAEAIFAAAEKAKQDSRELQKLRSDITICQRDVSKMLDAVIEASDKDLWCDAQERFRDLCARPSRSSSRAVLEAFKSRLEALGNEVRTRYLLMFQPSKMSANECQNERHIQSPDSESQIPHKQIDRLDSDFGFGGSARTDAPAFVSKRESSGPESTVQKGLTLSLEQVSSFCPQLTAYAVHGLRSWRDVVGASEVVSKMLGISADALRRARTAMGMEVAAVSVAIILEQIDQIRSPGGYLRDLTRKAERGGFSLKPMLSGLAESRWTSAARSG